MMIKALGMTIATAAAPAADNGRLRGTRKLRAAAAAAAEEEDKKLAAGVLEKIGARRQLKMVSEKAEASLEEEAEPAHGSLRGVNTRRRLAALDGAPAPEQGRTLMEVVADQIANKEGRRRLRGAARKQREEAERAANAAATAVEEAAPAAPAETEEEIAQRRKLAASVEDEMWSSVQYI